MGIPPPLRAASTRRRMSPAARREKVSRATWSLRACPDSMREQTRRTRNSVFPVPGPATTIWGPSASASTGPQSSGSSRISVNGTGLIVGSGRLGKPGDLRNKLGLNPVFGQVADRVGKRVEVGLGDRLECLEVAHIGEAIGRV